MIRLLIFVCCISAFVPQTGLAQSLPVDLELVLAVDASGSVDSDEFRLQTGGIGAAFREPRVWAAIRGGKTGKIAVAIVIWADATVPKAETGWFVIDSESDALAFADVVAPLERGVIGGTGMGEGIAVAIRKFDRNNIDGARQVVDVSGDGQETPPREIVVTMPTARSMALSRGVTINGLAILNEDETLGNWYRNNVIAGRQSFVMEVRDYDDFAAAMTRKLIREIDDNPKVGTMPYAIIGAAE